MKNIFIPLTLFLVMVILLTYSMFSLSKTCNSMYVINTNLENLIKQEKWDEANITVQKFMDEWDKHSNKISIFVHHREIDDIFNEISKLTQYVNYHNKDEAMASISTIKFLFKHILDLEQVKIQNIF